MLRMDLPISAHPEPGAGGKLLDPLEQGVGGRCNQKGEIVEKRLFIHHAPLLRIFEKALDLRSKGKLACVSAVIQRLHPDAVSNQPQFMAAGVPNPNRKHSAKAFEKVDAPLFEGVDDDLGV